MFANAGSQVRSAPSPSYSTTTHALARDNSGTSVGAAPPPGIVARLQADLQEAAEERRIARQQAVALREKVR